MKKKKNKSDSYQYKIVEIGMDPSNLEFAADQMSINDHFIRQAPNDEIVIAQKEMIRLIMEAIANHFTEHQKLVIKMTLEGKTQQTIADFIGIHQNAISKCLYGNYDYKRDRFYGGCVRKLQKHLLDNDDIQLLMRRIARFRNV